MKNAELNFVAHSNEKLILKGPSEGEDLRRIWRKSSERMRVRMRFRRTVVLLDEINNFVSFAVVLGA